MQDKDTIEYQADIEGYNLNNDSMPQLKNIDIRLKTMRVDNYTTIEKPTVYKQPLITTSPSITAGYDPINKKFGVMVGVSVNFNIWK